MLLINAIYKFISSLDFNITMEIAFAICVFYYHLLTPLSFLSC